MVWLYVEDSYYFSHLDEAIAIFQKKQPKLFRQAIEEVKGNIEFVFKADDLNHLLLEQKWEKIIFSPFLPKNILGNNSSFFGVFKIPNKYGLLTESEKKAGLTEYEKLQQETGLTVELSPVTFDDMAGSQKLREIARKLDIKYSMGEMPDAVFLAGIMGTGKSFFAQTLAGETSRYLVSFNLTKLMYSDNPIEEFDKIITFLEKEDKKLLFWIDEIEKMFTGSEKSEHMKNKFLTFLNDLGLTINIDAFVVMTANNVSDILKKNPELLRGGRVETYAKIFMDFPEKETAQTIFELYINKRNKEKDRVERLANFLISIDRGTADSTLWIYKYAQNVKDYLANKKIELSKEVDILKKILMEESQKTDVINNTLNKMIFPLKAEDIADYIDRNYIPVCDPKNTPENFPYVPAEIKEIVTQLYYLHLEKNFTNKNIDLTQIYDDLMRENIPIGEAGSIGIDVMKGNEDKFSVIVK